MASTVSRRRATSVSTQNIKRGRRFGTTILPKKFWTKDEDEPTAKRSCRKASLCSLSKLRHIHVTNLWVLVGNKTSWERRRQRKEISRHQRKKTKLEKKIFGRFFKLEFLKSVNSYGNYIVFFRPDCREQKIKVEGESIM